MKDFCTIPEAIAEIRKGKLLIVVDSPARENEGDLYIPADVMTARHITTMIRYGGGLICAAITEEQARRLALPLMVSPGENTEKTHVNFTISVNARKGLTTGVSAFDRARTIHVMANPDSRARHLAQPGHVFGLAAKPGGVLDRDGHTEAAVDLARLAGFSPAGVLCEVVGTSGRMAKRAELAALAGKLKIKMVLIRDLVRYLRENPLPHVPQSSDLVRAATSKLPTKYGTFEISIYESLGDRREHTALVLGAPKKPTMVRIHSQCITGDTFFSKRCDCGEQLEKSMRKLQQTGSGVILYLNQEGRGIGLTNKIRAYALQDRGYDTVEANHALGLRADARDYKIAADILHDLGIVEVNLLTNNPEKEKQLGTYGIHVVKSNRLESRPNGTNGKYLLTKKHKLGHNLKRV